MSVFLLILCTMVVGDVVWWVCANRRLPRRWMRMTAGLFVGLMLLGLGAIIISRRIEYPIEELLPRWAHSAILVWHLLVLLPWLALQFARNIVCLAKWIAMKHADHEPAPAPVPAEDGLSRRQFLSAAAVFTPAIVTAGAAAYGEGQLDEFRIRRMDVNVRDLPPGLDGFTIAHVTDVHVGRFTRGKVLERIAEATNALNADLVALTGDLINDSLRAMPAALDLVRAMRARRMVVTCEGNHDLIDNPREFYRQAEAGGLPLLRGETASFAVGDQKIQVLGLPWSRHVNDTIRDSRALLAKRDPNAWHLMLAHHPHAWDHLPDIPLTLTGHTHGGQLMVNEHQGAGPMMFRYWSGLYHRERNETLIVSNGTGNWFPVRIHAPAEIIHLTLRREIG
jgi:predicted MPP superfamily phosphohydrolase